MEYLLKASVVVAIFYICYKLFLQRDTFFENNRRFLLVGIFTAFCLPFVVIPIYIEQAPLNLDNFVLGNAVSVDNAEPSISLLQVLTSVYLLGIAFFFIKFLIQLVSLSKLLTKNESKKIGRYTFIETTNNLSPFSFFNWIVYNPNLFSKTELKQIITHEKVHVRQNHSIDILLTQLACVVLWFNPFMWLYNKDLKQNLEFIADQNAQQKSNCKKSYQYTLLKTSMPTHQSALTNNFYNSLIKKRIVMLHKSKSKKVNQFKYALVIPLLALLLMSFNTEDIYVQPKIQHATNSKEIKIIFNKNLTNNNLKKIIRTLKKENINFTYTNLKRNEKKEIISISTKFQVEKGNAKWNAYNTNNEPIKSFYFFKTNKSFGVSILNKEISEVEKSKENNKTAPWKVTSERNNTVFVYKDTIYVNEKPNILEKTVNEFDKVPLYILDGKEITKKDFEKINPFKIYSTTVFKGDYAIKKYGNKGKYGVVVIKLRNEDLNKTTFKLDNNALCIIDGKESSAKALEKIDYDNIKSIETIKGESATTKYGEKGKNGVIEITTKK